jgi:hypothetical protein
VAGWRLSDGGRSAREEGKENAAVEPHGRSRIGGEAKL